MHGINSQYLACSMTKSCCDSYTMLQKNVQRAPGHLDQSVGSRIGILTCMDCVRVLSSSLSPLTRFRSFVFIKVRIIPDSGF